MGEEAVGVCFRDLRTLKPIIRREAADYAVQTRLGAEIHMPPPLSLSRKTVAALPLGFTIPTIVI